MNLIGLLKSILIIYLLLGLLLYLFQRHMIYLPTAATAHNFTALEINQGHPIQALVTHDRAQQAILYFGGNAENVAYTAGDFFQEFPQHSTYLMQYRGYAGTAGSPSEPALFADALALYDAVKQKHPCIKVIGRSLGSGVATYLASQRPVDQLVLVTPFDSIRNVAQAMLPIYPMDWLLKDHYDSLTHIQQVQADTLVIAATQDRVIPPARTQNLIQSIPDHRLSTIEIPAGHNDLDLNPAYFQSIKNFFNCQQRC
ncbi:alpha/beta hydrolase [Marinicella meishanensis]|uniref:alpha/beta hydrolase n=1 Tax=Marinicella meishanensis TaxID=2873263 RepID=UPI001CBBA2FC|nr:alpha/beta hydrolase [Marinicella sp. NBU2979]